MTTATTNALGTFVWHDLMTSSRQQALAFYRELLPEWSVTTSEVAPGFLYDMLSVGEVGIGGIMELPASAGVPTHWISYVAVKDCAATVALAEEHGGKCIVPAHEMPGVGTFAVIQDPTGAFIKPFQMQFESNLPLIPLNGMVCWNELMSTNFEQAKAFYTTLFGWDIETMSFPPPTGDYTMFKLGERQVAGGMQIQPGPAIPSHWLMYFTVPDVDARAAQAIALGATAFTPCMDIPNIGRIIILSDPQGAVFGLFTMQA